MKELSIVRENLMTKEGYSPYCGLDAKCPYRWPRTKFNGKQFVCDCGWKSDFPEDFINRYKEKWNL
ncbi:hypothetical protein [Elizabethkingia ursingii]|uniref:hypothetical protein n=1 Tax=Elizabethkingia ursingii TaxID=1756150 RepID=UPI00075166D6|nr:hypothetical protein [Elizabethkingia ursingii]KUY28049.1 hypothetical protein ATB96_19630 [Elizabethkingia ursingii]